MLAVAATITTIATAAANIDTCDTKQRNHIKFSRTVSLVVGQTATNYTIRHCHWDGIYEVTLNAESKGGRSEEVTVSIILGTLTPWIMLVMVLCLGCLTP